MNGSKKVNHYGYIPDGPDDVILDPSGPLVKREGEPLTVQCSAECNPDCDYQWTHPDNTVTGGSILSIELIDRTQGGEFYCRAENTVGDETGTLTIDVQYPPDVTSVHVNPDTVVEGNATHIVCQAEGNPNINTFTWRNVSHSSGDMDGDRYDNETQSTVRIVNIRCQKQSEIECVARNTIGQSPVPGEVTLDVKCKYVLLVLNKY